MMQTVQEVIYKDLNKRWADQRENENRQRFEDGMIRLYESEARTLIIAEMRKRTGIRVDDLFNGIGVMYVSSDKNEDGTVTRYYRLGMATWNGGYVKLRPLVPIKNGKVLSFNRKGYRDWKAIAPNSTWAIEKRTFFDALYHAISGTTLPEPEEVAEYFRKYGIQ